MAETYDGVFRRAAVRVLALGVGVLVVSLGAALIVGESKAIAGAAWGGGAALLMALVTAGMLSVRWSQRPLLATGGVAVSFLLKVVVMFALAFILGGERSSYSPAWLAITLVIGVLGVLAIETATLAHGKTLTVVQLDDESEVSADAPALLANDHEPGVGAHPDAEKPASSDDA